MSNWYKKSQSAYNDFVNSPKKTYNDFGHPIEFIDSDPIYLWWYSYGDIVVKRVNDADDFHQDDLGMNFWGRYIAKENALSLSWDPYDSDEETYLDVLLGLEEKFGQNVKLFISSFGIGLQGPTAIAQAIKKVHNFSESNKEFFNRQKPRMASKDFIEKAKVMHAQGKNKKQAETVKIRDMYTLKPTSVYVARNPSWDELMSMIDRSYYGSLRLLKDKNGDVLAWDSKDGIHYQIASALGLNTNAYRADGPEIRIDEKWKLKLHNPPGPYSFNNFYDKKLKSIGSNEYLVVEDELV